MKGNLRSVLLFHLRTGLPPRTTPLPFSSTRTLRTRPSSNNTSSPGRGTGSEKRGESPAQGNRPSTTQDQASPPPPPPPSVSSTLATTNPENNNLLAPVHIPEDPNAVLKSDHPSTSILAQSGLVVQRQIEMMNLFIGFEQANRYVIMDPHGNHVGYMAEHDGGIGKTMIRQWFKTHRAFTTNVFDRSGKEVLRFHRPFSWIKTRIRVYDPLEVVDSSQIPYSSATGLATADIDVERRISSLPLEAMRVIGETHSEWAPLRRKYNLFLAHDPSVSSDMPTPLSSEEPTDLSSNQQAQLARQPSPSFAQFAYVDEPFLSWDFSLLGEDKSLIGSVNRNFAGFAREILTDTGVYALRMDSAGLQEESQKSHIISKTGQNQPAYAETVGGGTGMTLDQRAVMLATAVTVDFDYFSRHSGGGGYGFLPLWMGGGGEGAGGAAGGAVGGAAGAGEAAEGVVVGGAGRAVGGVAGGAAGAGEGAIAGAGTMAGYEAMQRGVGGNAGQESVPDQQYEGQPYEGQPYEGFPDPQSPQSGESGDVWGGGDNDPWSEVGSGGGGGGGGEGGWFSWLWDMFFGGGD